MTLSFEKPGLKNVQHSLALHLFCRIRPCFKTMHVFVCVCVCVCVCVSDKLLHRPVEQSSNHPERLKTLARWGPPIAETGSSI